MDHSEARLNIDSCKRRPPGTPRRGALKWSSTVGIGSTPTLAWYPCLVEIALVPIPIRFVFPGESTGFWLFHQANIASGRGM
jgi:hypothetical protein